MPPEPADLRALVCGDDELADICEEVLTVLEHSERLVETLNFNVVDDRWRKRRGRDAWPMPPATD